VKFVSNTVIHKTMKLFEVMLFVCIFKITVRYILYSTTSETLWTINFIYHL